MLRTAGVYFKCRQRTIKLIIPCGLNKFKGTHLSFSKFVKYFQFCITCKKFVSTLSNAYIILRLNYKNAPEPTNRKLDLSAISSKRYIICVF